MIDLPNGGINYTRPPIGDDMVELRTFPKETHDLVDSLCDVLTNTIMDEHQTGYAISGGLFLSGHGLEWNINVLTHAINELLEQHSGNCEVDCIR